MISIEQISIFMCLGSLFSASTAMQPHQDMQILAPLYSSECFISEFVLPQSRLQLPALLADIANNEIIHKTIDLTKENNSYFSLLPKELLCHLFAYYTHSKNPILMTMPFRKRIIHNDYQINLFTGIARPWAHRMFSDYKAILIGPQLRYRFIATPSIPLFVVVESLLQKSAPFAFLLLGFVENIYKVGPRHSFHVSAIIKKQQSLIDPELFECALKICEQQARNNNYYRLALDKRYHAINIESQIPSRFDIPVSLLQILYDNEFQFEYRKRYLEKLLRVISVQNRHESSQDKCVIS